MTEHLLHYKVAEQIIGPREITPCIDSKDNMHDYIPTSFAPQACHANDKLQINCKFKYGTDDFSLSVLHSHGRAVIMTVSAATQDLGKKVHKMATKSSVY